MANEEPDIRGLVGRLSIAHFTAYLVGRGWVERPSRYVDHLYFEVVPEEGGQRYELYVPAAANVPKYQTHVMRAIYKLCGIEDREPADIAQSILASEIGNVLPSSTAGSICLRIRNSSSSSFLVRIDSPVRELKMLSGEAIELQCQVAGDGSLEIDHGNTSLTIFTSGRRRPLH